MPIPSDAVAISTTEFFGWLTPEELARVRSQVEARKIYPRRRLFRAGDPADHLWVVERGEVRLLMSSARGQVTTLDTLRDGEMFGRWSGDPGERYAADAEATTEGRVWRLARAVVARLVDERPELSARMVQVIARRLRDAHERLHSFAYDGAPARLASALLRAGDPHCARVTRRALAEASGTTVETAIRVLRRFERDGLIRGEVGAIHIVDGDRLAALARDPATTTNQP